MTAVVPPSDLPQSPTPRPEAQRSEPGGRVRTALAAAAVRLPDRIPLMLFWACLVVSVTVTLGVFRPVVVVPAILVLVAATWRLLPEELPTSRAGVVGAVGAVVVALAWVAVNAPYASRFIVVSRDPGFLALGGIWLSDHPSAVIPAGGAYDVADAVRRATAAGSGMAAIDGNLYLQGTKLLPGLLAVAGWAGGDTAVLGGNLLVGAAALVAVYGLARRLTGPLVALLPVVALAASIPMTAFSRAAYTEPLAVALAFGGLTVIWSAFRGRDWRLHVVGAAMIGATGLVRIDGAATVVGLLAGYGLFAGATLLPRPRRRALGTLAAVIGVSAAVLVIGYLDLRLTSPKYLADLGSEYTMLLAATGASAVVALAVAAPRWWAPVRRALLAHRRVVGAVAGGAVLAVAAMLISRPLWMVNRNLDPESGYASLVGALQNRDMLVVDPTRSYDEMTVTWLSWYLGWPAVVLGFVGLALAVAWAVQRRDPRWLVLATVIGAPSALYLWRVSITPDQIWAVRRLLPLTIPGLLVLATVALVWVWQRRRASRGVTVAAGLAAAAFVAAPVLSWRGDLFTTVEQDGRWAQAHEICAALPAGRVVVVGAPSYVPTLRVMCDVEVVAFGRAPEAPELLDVRRAWDDDVAVLTFDAALVPWSGGQTPEPVRDGWTRTWEIDLDEIPAGGVTTRSTTYLGTIAPDGTVVPVAPAP
jgi:hypothetical protein